MTKQEVAIFRDWFKSLTEQETNKQLADGPYSCSGYELYIGGIYTDIKLESFCGNVSIIYHHDGEPYQLFLYDKDKPYGVCDDIQTAKNTVLEWLGMELAYTMNKINKLQKYSQGIKEKIDSLNKLHWSI